MKKFGCAAVLWVLTASAFAQEKKQEETLPPTIGPTYGQTIHEEGQYPAGGTRLTLTDLTRDYYARPAEVAKMMRDWSFDASFLYEYDRNLVALDGDPIIVNRNPGPNAPSHILFDSDSRAVALIRGGIEKTQKEFVLGTDFLYRGNIQFDEEDFGIQTFAPSIYQAFRAAPLTLWARESLGYDWVGGESYRMLWGLSIGAKYSWTNNLWTDLTYLYDNRDYFVGPEEGVGVDFDKDGFSHLVRLGQYVRLQGGAPWVLGATLGRVNNVAEGNRYDFSGYEVGASAQMMLPRDHSATFRWYYRTRHHPETLTVAGQAPLHRDDDQQLYQVELGRRIDDKTYLSGAWTFAEYVSTVPTWDYEQWTWTIGLTYSM